MTSSDSSDMAASNVHDALYTAEAFLIRVTAWRGDTPEELEEVLTDVREALAGAEEGR